MIDYALSALLGLVLLPATGIILVLLAQRVLHHRTDPIIAPLAIASDRCPVCQCHGYHNVGCSRLDRLDRGLTQ